MSLHVILPVKCPICNVIIDYYDPDKKRFNRGYWRNYGNFCPKCGYPKQINPPEHLNIKKCFFCDATNPAESNYCRYCGENIQLCGRENGHGWVDLGLSVLWSSETLRPYYQFMDSEFCFLDTFTPTDCLFTMYHPKFYEKYKDSSNPFTDYNGNGEDVATRNWGSKWRTPTKEEFEELINKCKWEEITTTDTKEYALKATGPNGKYIIIKPTFKAGYLGEDFDLNVLGIRTKIYYDEHEIAFWSTTEAEPRSGRKMAFSFIWNEYIHIYDTKDKWPRIIDTQVQKTPRIAQISQWRALSIRPVMDK